MRKLWLLAFIFFLFAPHADAKTLYVRPFDGGPYGTGTGLSYANAFRGFAAVTWSTAGVSSTTADTLKICGSFNSNDFDGGGIAMLSVDQASTTMDGNCADQGDLAQAILQGDGSRDHGLYCATNVLCAGQTWKNIRVNDFDTRGFYFRNDLNFDAAANFTGTNLYCEDIVGPEVNLPQCIAGFGYVAAMSNITSITTTDDSIHWEGNDVSVDRSYMVYPGYQVTTNLGDCVQITNRTDNARITNSYCDKSSSPTKQCYIFGDPPSGEGTEMSDNICILPTTGNATNQNKSMYSSATSTKFLRNYVVGGYYGIYMLGPSSIAVGNVLRDQELRGIDVVSTVQTGSSYVVNNTVFDAGSCYVLNGGAGVTINVYNNIGMNCSTAGYTKGGSSALVQADNVSYNNGANSFAGGTINAYPRFIGGLTPDEPNDFRLIASSTLISAGMYVGAIKDDLKDYMNRAFEYAPSIGAFQTTWRDFITNRALRNTRI